MTIFCTTDFFVCLKINIIFLTTIAKSNARGEICQKRILVYIDNIIDIKLKDFNRYQWPSWKNFRYEIVAESFYIIENKYAGSTSNSICYSDLVIYTMWYIFQDSFFWYNSTIQCKHRILVSVVSLHISWEFERIRFHRILYEMRVFWGWKE